MCFCCPTHVWTDFFHNYNFMHLSHHHPSPQLLQWSPGSPPAPLWSTHSSQNYPFYSKTPIIFLSCYNILRFSIIRVIKSTHKSILSLPASTVLQPSFTWFGAFIRAVTLGNTSLHRMFFWSSNSWLLLVIQVAS